MSDYETEIVSPESAAGPAGIGDGTPAAEPFQVSRDEWESFRAESSAIAGYIQQQQAAQQQYEQQVAAEQYQEQLEDLMYEDPEAYARAIAEQTIATHVQPLAQELERLQNEEAFAKAEDDVLDIFDELEVAEEQRDEVRALANENLVGQALQIVLGQHGQTPENVAQAAQSIDPVARQWAASVMQWADGAAHELIAGNEEAARIALSEAAASVLGEQEAEAHIKAGGSVSDLVFGGGPRRSQGDYMQGDSVSRRMFGGGA